MVHVKQKRLQGCLAVTVLLVAIISAQGEDGYKLWLRYEPLSAPASQKYKSINSLIVTGDSATANAIRSEFITAFTGMLGNAPAQTSVPGKNTTLLIGTATSSDLIAQLQWTQELTRLGPEGYIIRSIKIASHPVIVIASSDDLGALYGSFHFLRLMQTQSPIENLDISKSPRLRLRLLDHWDNLDGSIERGYAGRSLWDWSALPDRVDPRLKDYARANASVGINGSLLNNVNANATILTSEYLKKVAAIADVFRPYGVRVYLSPRFSAPMEIGGLKTADPLSPEVAKWWKEKVDEIYRLIPDFGGFVVKANSEGQPGPRTYNRTHADGANMMAAALAEHHGLVMWRAFVYDVKPGYDRAGAAYENLQPFDGKFADNVLLQVKNGPIDFQPREPFHPLFGAMPKTKLVPEVQITQEYLGFSNHLVFLAQMWREFLDSDTHANGQGSTVIKVIDGTLNKQSLTGLVGVANTGSDRNWTGHHFLQANWYAFGRLAWDPDLPAETIASEWIGMTFTNDPQAVKAIGKIMLGSWEAIVDYMTPLGLHHIMWGKTHYGPAPWWDTEPREDWNPVYFHKAEAGGIGFDRTKTGSNSVSQYHKQVSEAFGNLNTCPEKFLLWFHHLPWDYRMRSGRILWEELCLHYQRGVDWVRTTRKEWAALSGKIDPERHAEIDRKLALQERDAIWWRDSVILYFQTFSKRPLPAGVEKPAKTLEEYKKTPLPWN